ncbi:MAG: hypothetical protein N2690_13260, partial [Rhodocyclaceae bacterium]|nr:hypothetical protein [Rhodocyclaceae bacterium]
MAPAQRDGFEYEFTTVLELSLDGHLASVSKDRTGLFDGRDPAPLSPETGRMLLEWLISGAPPRAQNPRKGTAKASQRPLEAFLRRRQWG